MYKFVQLIHVYNINFSCYLHCWHCPAEKVFHEATAISSSLVYDMEFHFRNMQNKHGICSLNDYLAPQ